MEKKSFFCLQVYFYEAKIYIPLSLGKHLSINICSYSVFLFCYYTWICIFYSFCFPLFDELSVVHATLGKKKTPSSLKTFSPSGSINVLAKYNHLPTFFVKTSLKSPQWFCIVGEHLLQKLPRECLMLLPLSPVPWPRVPSQYRCWLNLMGLASPWALQKLLGRNLLWHWDY